MLGQNQRRVGRHLRVVKTSKLSQPDGMRLLSCPNFSYFAAIAHPCIHIQIEPKRKKFRNSDGRKQLKYLLSEVIKIFGALNQKIFQVLLWRGGLLSDVPHVRGRGCWHLQEVLLPLPQRHHLQPGEARVWRLVQRGLLGGIVIIFSSNHHHVRDR